MEDIFSIPSCRITDQNGLLIIHYQGVFSPERLFVIRNYVLKKMSCDETICNLLKGIFIELTQNVRLHSEQKQKVNDVLEGEGVLDIELSQTSMKMVSTNKISMENHQKLEHKYRGILSMNKEDLRSLKRSIRMQEREGNSQGAGIGLIKMKFHADDFDFNISFVNSENHLSVKFEKTNNSLWKIYI